MLVDGEPIPVDEARAKEIMELEDFELQVELGIGEAEAKYWTCDFSYVSFFLLFCIILNSDGHVLIGVHRNMLGSTGIIAVR